MNKLFIRILSFVLTFSMLTACGNQQAAKDNGGGNKWLREHEG